MNDLVSHDPAWSVVPNKLPSDIPKFKGKAGEDPSEHVTTFHLWFSSNFGFVAPHSQGTPHHNASMQPYMGQMGGGYYG